MIKRSREEREEKEGKNLLRGLRAKLEI